MLLSYQLFIRSSTEENIEGQGTRPGVASLDASTTNKLAHGVSFHLVGLRSYISCKFF